MSSLRRKLISAMVCASLCSPVSSALSTEAKCGFGIGGGLVGAAIITAYLKSRKNNGSDDKANSGITVEVSDTTNISVSNSKIDLSIPKSESKFEPSNREDIIGCIGQERYDYLFKVCKELFVLDKKGDLGVDNNKIVDYIKSIDFVRFVNETKFENSDVKKFVNKQIGNNRLRENFICSLKRLLNVILNGKGSTFKSINGVGNFKGFECELESEVKFSILVDNDNRSIKIVYENNFITYLRVAFIVTTS